MSSDWGATEDWLLNIDYEALEIELKARTAARDRVKAGANVDDFELRVKIELIATFVGSENNRYAKGIAEKLRQKQGLSPQDRAYMVRRRRKPGKPIISAKVVILLDETVSKALLETSKPTPSFLFRAYSTGDARPYKTHMASNGLSCKIVIAPGKATIHQGPRMRKDISDMGLDEIARMLGHHLSWEDRTHDEFMSFTDSFLFAITHAYLRHLDGQSGCYVAMINWDRASKYHDWYADEPEHQGESDPPRIYHALQLCDIVNLFGLSWYKKELEQLHPRKFTHEFIFHGIMQYPDDDVLEHVSLADLIENGLFELLPELEVPAGKIAAGLYTVLYHLRETLHHNHDKFPCEARELEIAVKLARLFTRLRPGEKKEDSRPSLYALLHLLSLRRRGIGDERFMKLIKDLGYTLADLKEGQHEGYEKRYDNLPEKAALLNLMRDVQAVVGGEPLKEDVIITTYSNRSDVSDYMAKKDKDFVKVTPLVPDRKMDQYVEIGKCDLSCGCRIWRNKTKSEMKNTKAKKDDDDDDVGTIAITKKATDDVAEDIAHSEQDDKVQKDWEDAAGLKRKRRLSAEDAEDGNDLSGLEIEKKEAKDRVVLRRRRRGHGTKGGVGLDTSEGED